MCFKYLLEEVKNVAIFEDDNDEEFSNTTSSSHENYYKFVIIFKESTLLHIFEVIETVFKNICQKSQLSSNQDNFIITIRLLSDCIKLYKSPIKKSRN